ncbi:MAG TPA: hypothetical protein VD794_13395 [Flavisolibacter sp.]|nr:hypothetical protein [Flavisolibacter sp.]
MLLPQGMVYDKKNGKYRTSQNNLLFDISSNISTVYTKAERGQTERKLDLSSLVPLYLEKSNQIEDSLTAFKEFFEHVVIIGDLPPSATVNAYLKRMNQRKK